MAKQIHEMSDEEISQLTPDQVAELTKQAPKEEEAEEVVEEQEVPEPTPDEEPEEEETEDNATPEEEKANEQEVEGADDTETNAAPAGKADAQEAGKGKAAKDEPADKKADKSNEQGTVNAEDQLKALFAPFKANGREMSVTNIEEARQLMQFGANYSKKMQSLKPHLAIVRTLENAGIGDAELSFLIDLHKKDPAAINKLVKDSKIDPMDLSNEKADSYTPKNHKATDAEVELESVLAELDGSEGLDKTLNIVTKEWDKASKQVVGANPQLLKIINQHVESGAYDMIAAAVDKERALGRLLGLTDLEAYRQVGDAMHASGKFAHINGKATKDSQQAPAAPVVAAPDPKKADDSKRNEQKRGVAPVKAAPAGSKKADPDFNPLSMSDEEFMKKFAN